MLPACGCLEETGNLLERGMGDLFGVREMFYILIRVVEGIQLLNLSNFSLTSTLLHFPSFYILLVMIYLEATLCEALY